MLRGGWYRIPLTAEESASTSRQRGAGRQGCRQQGAACRAHEGTAASRPPAANFHYRHAGLEQLLARPAGQRAELPELLADSDRNVAADRGHWPGSPGRCQNRFPAGRRHRRRRSAAAGPLCGRRGPGSTARRRQWKALRTLVDHYGQFTPGASTGYQADLHAELLRALARHVDAADDPRFLAAVQVPSALVRIETLRAWAAGTRGSDADRNRRSAERRRPAGPRRGTRRPWPRENRRRPAIF